MVFHGAHDLVQDVVSTHSFSLPAPSSLPAAQPNGTGGNRRQPLAAWEEYAASKRTDASFALQSARRHEGIASARGM